MSEPREDAPARNNAKSADIVQDLPCTEFAGPLRLKL